uniref:Uncharacterized protein n=1 Tax=Acrobeloides nanus TaxID=290746 RepID=A0A914CSX5_9BILA
MASFKIFVMVVILNGAYGQTQVITSDIQNLINSVVANLKASLQTLLAALQAALVGSVTN